MDRCRPGPCEFAPWRTDHVPAPAHRLYGPDQAGIDLCIGRRNEHQGQQAELQVLYRVSSSSTPLPALFLTLAGRSAPDATVRALAASYGLAQMGRSTTLAPGRRHRPQRFGAASGSAGHFRETFRDTRTVDIGRAASTAIDSCSRAANARTAPHRCRRGLAYTRRRAGAGDGRGERARPRMKLGPDIATGEWPQGVCRPVTGGRKVSATGCWWAARSRRGLSSSASPKSRRSTGRRRSGGSMPYFGSPRAAVGVLKCAERFRGHRRLCGGEDRTRVVGGSFRTSAGSGPTKSMPLSCRSSLTCRNP